MAGVQHLHQGLTVAGAAQAGRYLEKNRAVLLPVELQSVNRAASTNAGDFNHLSECGGMPFRRLTGPRLT